LSDAGNRELGMQAEVLEWEIERLRESDGISQSADRELHALGLQLSGWRLGSRRSPLVLGDYLAQLGELLESSLRTGAPEPESSLGRLIQEVNAVAQHLSEPDDAIAANLVNELADESMSTAAGVLPDVVGVDQVSRSDVVLDRAESWVVRWERACGLGRRVWKALPATVRLGVPFAGLALRFYESVATFLLHAFR
jgi:hypothetical protein